MVRANWKGHLRLSLVSVPVQAVTASVVGRGEIHFHQLHESCHSRIKYQKVCPIHGEVPNSEIVSGYEYSKGKYVVVDPDEFESVAGEGDRVVNIDTFVEPQAVDPLYFDGRSYYLIPDGAAARKPYGVLCEAMEKRRDLAVANCVFSRRSQLVLIRPLESILVMNVLKYASQLKQPEAIQNEVGALRASAAEVKLAQMLIDASTSKHFNLAEYVDDYTDKLTELIDAKVKGKEIVAPPAEESPPVINLMDALRRSVGKKKTGAASRPRKAVSRSARERRPAHSIARRKSS